MKLHESGEDYLEAIFVLQKKKGMVRSIDVSQHLGVKKPSVCNAVSILEQGGFLVKDEDHFLHLTEKGTHRTKIEAGFIFTSPSDNAFH